jgi:NTE family protein
MLRLHHQIERDLREVAQRIPTVVLPTGVDHWPAPWDLGSSRRLIATSSGAARRFLDQLDVAGPGLYRTDDVASAASTGTGADSVAAGGIR